MTFVKVCGITQLDDARHAAEAGATALGFVFWPQSPRYIEPERAAAIVAAVPGVETVGVFVDAPLEDVRRTIDCAGVSTVQLHGGETAALAAGLDRPILRAMTVTASDQEYDSWPHATIFLLDAIDPVTRGGSGQRVDWAAAAGIAARRRVVLAGGLTPENVADAIAAVRPYGVDVSSGVERAPGVKDPDKVTRFVSRARSAFAER